MASCDGRWDGYWSLSLQLPPIPFDEGWVLVPFSVGTVREATNRCQVAASSQNWQRAQRIGRNSWLGRTCNKAPHHHFKISLKNSSNPPIRFFQTIINSILIISKEGARWHCHLGGRLTPVLTPGGRWCDEEVADDSLKIRNRRVFPFS